MSAVLGLLTTSTLLYASLLPTTAVYVNSPPNVTFAFTDAEMVDLGKLRDYTLVLVLCGAFGLAQVVSYLIYTTKA